jgi:hypothetical protein
MNLREMSEEPDLKWLLEKQIAWIAAADSKVAVLGPLPLAMMAISLSDAYVAGMDFSWQHIPLAASTLFLCVSLFYSKATLSPRLNGPKQSNVFFGQIAKSSASEFRAILNQTSKESWKHDLIDQIHRNACIADNKHKNVQRAIFWLTIASPIWLLSILLGS